MTKTETYRNHNTYTGEITVDDFNTNFPNKKRIYNQADANDFYKKLETERHKKQMEESYKHMTLEELREMRIISNTNGRPLPSLTNEKWQKEFNVRKMFITPITEKGATMRGKYSKESGIWNEETQGAYYGSTNWQEYCSYINDVLRNIRAGQVDYCYFIYQIMDLAKFHYNNFKTKYCDGYWEVWLER